MKSRLINVQTILSKRSKSNDLTIYSPTDYSKLVNFDHMGENYQTNPKAISTTGGPEIKIDTVLESLRLTLPNEVLILS